MAPRRYASESEMMRDLFGRGMAVAPKVERQRNEKAIAIYHEMRADEGFEQTAQILFKLVRESEERFPGRERLLFLDIDGHREPQGGFDPDAYELQRDFVSGFLGDFVSGVRQPLVSFTNPTQRDDLPDTPPEIR